MHQRHSYRAEMVGRGIVVRDEAGKEVKVNFAGTMDSFTVTAFVPGVGYIGGWTCGLGPTPRRKKAPAWAALVDSINCGIVYPEMGCLPNSYGRQTPEQRRFREGW